MKRPSKEREGVNLADGTGEGGVHKWSGVTQDDCFLKSAQNPKS